MQRIQSGAQNVPKSLLGSRERNLKADLNKSGLEKQWVEVCGGWLFKDSKGRTAEGVQVQRGSNKAILNPLSYRKFTREVDLYFQMYVLRGRWKGGQSGQ